MAANGNQTPELSEWRKRATQVSFIGSRTTVTTGLLLSSVGVIELAHRLWPEVSDPTGKRLTLRGHLS